MKDSVQIDYSSLFKAINDEIIRDDSLVAHYKEEMRFYSQMQSVCSFDLLMHFLDYFSQDNCLELIFTITDDAIAIQSEGRSIIIDELYALYGKDPLILNEWIKENLVSSQDLNHYFSNKSHYLNSRRNTNQHITLLHSLISLCNRIDFTLDGSIYSLNERDWDAYSKKLPWQFMPHIISANDGGKDYRNQIILYPNDITAFRNAINSFPAEKLLFLETKRINYEVRKRDERGGFDTLFNQTKNEVSISYTNSDYDDYKDLLIYRIRQGCSGDIYYAVIGGDDIIIPEVSKKLFQSDPKTPDYLSIKESIHINFAINLKERRYNHFEIDPHGRNMSIYSINNGKEELKFPFYCDAPFVYDENNSENIDLDSAFNKWVIAKIPDLFFRQSTKLPRALFLSGGVYSRIIPSIIVTEDAPDIKRICASAVLNSEVPFLPSCREGFLKIKDSFINTTSLTEFDDLVMEYLRNKYHQPWLKLRHGISISEGLEWLDLPSFGEEDLFSFYKDDYREILSISRYCDLIYQIFLSLRSYSTIGHVGQEYYTELIIRLANSPCLPSESGAFAYPRTLIYNNPGTLSLPDFKLVPPYLKLFDDKKYHGDNLVFHRFDNFLKAIGVSTVLCCEICTYDENENLCESKKINLLEEGYNNTIQIIDERGCPCKYFPLTPHTVDPYHRSLPKEVSWRESSSNPELRWTCYSFSEGQKYYGVLSEDLRIIVPFRPHYYNLGYSYQNISFAEEHNLIIVKEHIHEREHIRFIYTPEGEELFPGDKNEFYGMRIVKLLTNNKAVVLDNGIRLYTKRYYILQPDRSTIPIKEEFYQKGNSAWAHGPYYSFFDVTDELVIAKYHDTVITESQVINVNGEVIIPPQSEGVFFYNQNNSVFVFKHYYDGMSSVFSANGLFLFNMNSKYVEEVSCSDRPFCKINTFPIENNLIKVGWFYNSFDSPRQMYGLIDQDFKFVMPTICDTITPVSEGNTYYRIQVNGKYGVINKSGLVSIPVVFDFIKLVAEHYIIAYTGCQIEKDEHNRTFYKGGLKQFISLDGKALFEGIHFEKTKCVRNDLWILKRLHITDSRTQNGKSGVVEINGFSPTEIVPFMFDYIIPNRSVYFVNNGGVISTADGKTIQGGKWGVYDNSLIIDCLYDSISNLNFLSHNYYKLRLNGKKGIATSDGTIIIPINYDHVFNLSYDKGLYWFRLNNNGTYDPNTKRVIGGEWYFFNIQDRALSPKMDYEYVGNFSTGIAVFMKDGKYGYLNSDYVTCIPNIFEYAQDFNYNGEAKVILEGKRYVIDRQSNQIGEWNESKEAPVFDHSEEDYGYSQNELDQLYHDAFDGNSDAQWNLD